MIISTTYLGVPTTVVSTENHVRETLFGTPYNIIFTDQTDNTPPTRVTVVIVST